MSVLIADDHRLVRECLGILVAREGFQVVCEAANGREALAGAIRYHPDVAVLDLNMPLMDGVEVAQELERCAPHTKAIALSRHDDGRFVLAAMRAGVKGYVLKSQPALELVDAITQVAAGAIYLSPGIAEVVVHAVCAGVSLPADPLSPRERQMLKLIAEGCSTKECASILEVSIKTADSHRTRLMRKLDIHATAGLVRYAFRHRLADA